MTLQECYAALGGNYEDVTARLRSERLVRKFLLKFPQDKSYELFCTMMEQHNYEEAFRAVHTIKGVCQNLSFTRLLESSSRLADALRHGWTPEADTLTAPFAADYKATIAVIARFSSESEGA